MKHFLIVGVLMLGLSVLLVPALAQEPAPTPSQALVMLDGAVAQMQLSRLDHVRLQQAVAVLKKALDEYTRLQNARGAGGAGDPVNAGH